MQNTNGLTLLPGISDLGGLIIDFQGGNYKINNPILFPPGIGNIVVCQYTSSLYYYAIQVNEKKENFHLILFYFYVNCGPREMSPF